MTMKYLVYAALLFIGARLFLPDNTHDGLQNLPILIALISCVLLYFLIRAAKRLATAFKIKQILVRSRADVKRFSVISNIFPQSGRYDIVAESRVNTINIVLLMRKRKHYRYHFDSVNRLEYYTGSRFSMRAGGRATIIARAARTAYIDTTTRVGKRRLPFETTDTNRQVDIIIMDKLPRAVTDSKSQHELGSGDMICDRVYLFDIGSFETRVDDVI